MKIPEQLFFFHGNGETVSDYLELLVPIFEQMGINLFLAEYRGYSMSTGTPALKSMLGDVKHIVNAIGLPPQQLILYGRSIGSLYAVHGVQQFPDIAGLIIESGVALILERVLMRVHPQELNVPLKELEEATEKDFNHQQKLAGFNGKTLVLHAQHDSLVHVAHGKKLYDWAPEPKHIKIFEKGDHNDILVTNAEVYFRLIFEFIAQL